MQKIVDVTELQRQFKTIFDEIAHKKTPYLDYKLAYGGDGGVFAAV
jgi:hypothetical protein